MRVFVDNLRCAKRLLRSIARSGQCRFDPAQQRFDRSAIHCDFVNECLRAAEAVPASERSETLTWAVKVAVWTCRLRAAVQSDLWAISPRGDLNRLPEEQVQQHRLELVDDILEDLDAANFSALSLVNYLAAHLNVLQLEVRDVQLEADKRKFVVKFRDAFRRGRLRGRPFGLSVAADPAAGWTLQEAVAGAEQWPHALGHPNSVIAQLVKIAVFVMRLREEIAQENLWTASPDLTYPADFARSSDLSRIVEELNMSAVMRVASEKVDRLIDRAENTRALRQLSEFWHRIHAFALAQEAELSSSSMFFVVADELSDVLRDSVEKLLVMDGCLLFKDCAALGDVAAVCADRTALLQRCRDLLRDYSLRRQKLAEPADVAWSGATHPGAVVIASAAVLGNFLRALLASSYDSFDRNWLDSAAIKSAPSLQDLCGRLQPDTDLAAAEANKEFSMQRVLCAVRQLTAAPLHVEVCALRTILERQLEDRVSIREMNVALSDPNQQSRERYAAPLSRLLAFYSLRSNPVVLSIWIAHTYIYTYIHNRSGQPFVADSSVAYSRTVLARIEAIGLFNHFDSEQVYHSFRLLTALRTALRAKDFAAMHLLVAQHVCDGRTDLEATSKVVGSGCLPSVVPAAKAEFVFLANFAHNYLFCESVKSALLTARNAVSGSRGALTYPTISWAALDSAAALSAHLSPLLVDSATLAALAEEVSSMRRQTCRAVAGDGQHDLTTLEDLQRVASRIGDQIGRLPDPPFSFFAHWTEVCAAVRCELDLVEAHCVFFITREALKVELMHPSIVIDARGLTVDLTRHEIMVAVIFTATSQHWEPDLSPAEEEGSRMLNYASSILQLLQLAKELDSRDAAGETRCLLPGSASFSTAVETLRGIQRHRAAVVVPMGCGELEVALREHDVLLLFDDLTSLYQVKPFEVLLL